MAACSSGEEAYSLAMVCEELRLDYPSFDYRVLGTDIDTEQLRLSESGVYDRSHIVNLPPMHQQKYFEFSGQKNSADIKVGETLRQRVKFRQYNLIKMADNFSIKFNVIFVRNVLFYFSKATVVKIVYNLIDQLEPGGLLFVSLTETVLHMEDQLTCVESSIYQKKR